jgi:hypothetical protein
MATDPTATAPDAQPLPAWKRALFIAITVSLPLVLLLLIELALRLFGWGGYPEFIRRVGTLPSGAQLCIVEPAASKPYFFANPSRPGYAEQSSFCMPKPAGTVRIVLIGESAAKGYPQPSNLAMSAFLGSMLSDAWPGRRVEVVNLGTTAIASFPLIYQVRDALRYDPDLFVFYVGNNEFFGAYGTASINASGTMPTWALPLMRAARGLAVVQAVEGVLRGRADENRTLMEQMIGQTVIPADSSLRAAAARNLRTNLERMLADVKAAGVQAVVCTTASNESGLAPLGEDDQGGLDAAGVAEIARLAAAPPAAAACDTLRAAAARAPGSAWTQFALARSLQAAGDVKGAKQAFLRARDLDTMPWRPTSQTEQAIRDAAASQGAVLCDVAERFRDLSPEGATGWELLDDHVHPSLRGQAEVARAVVQCMSGLSGGLAVDPAAVAALPGWQAYADRLRANEWDTYRVNHTLRTLFGVPFMKRSNPAAFERFDGACRAFESTMSPGVRKAAGEWQTSVPHAGGLRPLTGMVARVLLQEDKVDAARALYEVAQLQVPTYTSWHLEYIYFTLACREKLRGSLTEQDRAEAASAIAEGNFLLGNGFSESGLTERYVGRLHQLRGEWAEAIPPLLAARPRMRAEDLVACDQALFMSYVRTGNAAAARTLAEEGMRSAGRFAPVYQRLRSQLGQ